MSDLTAELRKCDRSTQIQFDKLQYDKKVLVRDRYLNHVKACEKCGIGPEPMYLTEIVNEVRAARV